MLNTKTLAVTTVGLAFLAGCGGSGNDPYVPPPMPVQYISGTNLPTAVETQITEVVSFGKAQIAMTSESRDPELLGTAMLATSESADPSDI